MTFLALDVQKNYMISQRSSLEFQQICNSSNLQMVTQTLSNLAAQDSDGNVMESAGAQRLQYLQQMYDQVQTSIESQLKSLNAQIESFQKAVDTNIKNDCKLNISV